MCTINAAALISLLASVLLLLLLLLLELLCLLQSKPLAPLSTAACTHVFKGGCINLQLAVTAATWQQHQPPRASRFSSTVTGG
jgi:hypothetical protein